MPPKKEVWKFMCKQSKPYKFEYVKEVQPLRISIERETIYVNERVLMNVIKLLVDAGLDWKEVMIKNLMHEKAHKRYIKWNLRWGVAAAKYGWLPSYLTDIVIDKIHFKENARYQKWLLADSRHAFKTMQKEIWDLAPTIASRPHFFYTQASYWVAVGAITLDEAANLYPEKADFIVELSELFKRIKSEQDLAWAFPQAKSIYLKRFASHQSRF
jgi:hypothetical protein